MVIGIPLAVLSGVVFILGCLFTLPDMKLLLAARESFYLIRGVVLQ
jgi:hypothetical protein